LRVPEDVSVICFDYSNIPSLVPSQLTVVDIRAEEMASQAAQMLLSLLQGEPLAETQVLLAPKFIMGDGPDTPARQ
jgi:DNA-binding LacI/PurR family transcriptional regulator